MEREQPSDLEAINSSISTQSQRSESSSDADSATTTSIPQDQSCSATRAIASVDNHEFESPKDIPLGTVSSPILHQEEEEEAFSNSISNSTSTFQSLSQSAERPSTSASQSQEELTTDATHSKVQEVELDSEGEGDLSFSPTHSRHNSESASNSFSRQRQLSMNGIHSALESIHESGLNDQQRQSQSIVDQGEVFNHSGEDMGDMGTNLAYDDSGEEEDDEQGGNQNGVETSSRKEIQDRFDSREETPSSSPITPGIVVHQASPSKTRSSSSRPRPLGGDEELQSDKDEEKSQTEEGRSVEQVSNPTSISQDHQDQDQELREERIPNPTSEMNQESTPTSTHQPKPTYTRPAKVSHGRIDSLPPQKYEIPPALPLKVSPYSLARDTSLVEEDNLDQPSINYGRVRSLSGTHPSSSSNKSQTSSFNGPSPDLKRTYSPNGRLRSHSNSSDSTEASLTGEAERAGLDFEEVGLDLEGHNLNNSDMDPNFLSYQTSPRRRSTSPSRTIRSTSPSPSHANGKGTSSPYGTNAASFSKSSVEIRSDSIASGSKAAKKISKAAKQKAEEEEKRRIEQELRDGWKLRRLSAHSNNGGENDEDGDGRRSVEGRYRGRTSRGNSRSNSPEPPSSPYHHQSSSNIDQRQQPKESQFARGWAQDEEQKRKEREEELRKEAEEEVKRNGVGMMVAGEDGELEVVGVEIDASQAKEHVEDEQQNSARESSATNRSESSTKTNDLVRASISSSTAPSQPNNDMVSESNKSDSVSASKTSLSTSQQATTSPSTPPSPILTDAADKPRTKHSRKPSKGPSALEQHISKTRMAHLPPKAKLEESKHLNSFESMMKQSKLLEQKRQEEEALAKIERENELNERTKRWEKEILPNWNKSRKDENLKSLWKLGCPPNLRGRVWMMASGNAQMLPRGLLTQARGVKEEKKKELKEANDQDAKQDSDSEPICKEDREAIEEDISRTLPTLKLFQKDIGPLYDDLKDVLEGLVMVRYDQLSSTATSTVNSSPTIGSSDQGPDFNTIQIPVYQMGLAALSATLLCNLSPQETLIALINMIEERPWLKSIYSLNHAIKQKSEVQKWLESNVKGKSKAGSINKTFSLFSSSSSKSNDSEVLTLPKGVSFQDLASQAIEATSASRKASFLKSTKGHERVFSTLLADRMPKVYANLGHNNVDIGEYVRGWVSELFTRVVSLDCASRIWDLV